jgi:hypothetical protein
MDRIQKALAINNFLLFLSLRKIHTNRPTYFEYLLLWIIKTSTDLTLVLHIINKTIYKRSLGFLNNTFKNFLHFHFYDFLFFAILSLDDHI